MAAPYSEDMRRKAIAAVKRDERKTDVTQMFGISRNTLDLWLKREAETGECRAITHYQQGWRHTHHGLGTVSGLDRAAWWQDASATGRLVGLPG